LPAVLFLACTYGSEGQPGGAPYKVLKKYEVGGDGGWDYLTIDPDGRRLYISRANRVMVVDIDNGKLVGEIANTKGVHGIAIAPKHKKGFTSNGGDSTATIFDLTTLKETGRVKVGASPDPILYDPASDRVFTFNAKGNDATAIAADSGAVVGSVQLGGRPEAGVADGKGMVYVNIVDKSEVVAFDAKKLEVKNRWPVAAAKQPVGLAIDTAKSRLFVSCRSPHMVILDIATGKALDTLPIGKGTDAAVFDSGLAFSSNGGDGNVSIIEEAPDGKYRLQANLETAAGAKTMALDPKTHTIFLAAQPKGAGDKKGAFTILVVGK